MRPALLTRMSIRPNASATPSNSAFTSSGAATSPLKISHRTPAARTSLGGFLGRRVVRTVGDRDVRALAGEPHGYGAADAPPATGDDRHASLLDHATSPLSANANMSSASQTRSSTDRRPPLAPSDPPLEAVDLDLHA